MLAAKGFGEEEGTLKGFPLLPEVPLVSGFDGIEGWPKLDPPPPAPDDG